MRIKDITLYKIHNSSGSPIQGIYSAKPEMLAAK